MTIIEAIILGIVQGITEFFPVSSSGHLLLVSKILGIDAPSMSFSLAVHLATLAAVVTVFWKDIVKIIKKPIQNLTLYLIIATIPAAIAGLLLNNLISAYSDNILYLGIGFMLTAALLLFASSLKAGTIEKENMKWHDALFIGVMQMIAVLPGISRSGSTVTAGFFKKIKKEDAVTFSFLLSIPVILGGAVLEGYKAVKTGFVDLDILPTLVGMLFAGIAGFFSIRIFLKTVMKGKIKYFSYYVAALGVFCILDTLIFHILA